MIIMATAGTPVVPRPGQVVLVRRDITPLDPFDILTAPWSPHFAHTGICIGPNQMVASVAGKGVGVQAANGQTCFGFDPGWDMSVVKPWLDSKMGMPYDWQAYLYIAFPFFYPRSAPKEDRYICSSLVGEALMKFSPLKFSAYRSTTPDDVARALGAI